MFITVGICIYNCAELVRQTLASPAAMRPRSDVFWEIAIANNNSTEHTDQVIGEYADRLPLQREFEPRRGGFMRPNRAIDVAKGEYILWTDDDVIVDAGWLAAYVEAFRRWPRQQSLAAKSPPNMKRLPRSG